MNQEDTGAFELFAEESIRDVVIQLCCVLYDNGIKEIHVGGLMRLLGVDEETASEHDDELMVLNDAEKFESVRQSLSDSEEKVPPGTTLH